MIRCSGQSMPMTSACTARPPTIFANTTENGLIRITLSLPRNMRLLDCGSADPCPRTAQPTSEAAADVWRSVPSLLNVRITGPDVAPPVWPRVPNPRGGYQLDARLDTLQTQALNALRDHAEISVDPREGAARAGLEGTSRSAPPLIRWGIQAIQRSTTDGSAGCDRMDRHCASRAVRRRLTYDRHSDAKDRCRSAECRRTGSDTAHQVRAAVDTGLGNVHNSRSECVRPLDPWRLRSGLGSPCSRWAG